MRTADTTKITPSTNLSTEAATTPTRKRPATAPITDPFTAAAHHDHQDERPHACDAGWVTVGYLVEDENGDELVVTAGKVNTETERREAAPQMITTGQTMQSS